MAADLEIHHIVLDSSVLRFGDSLTGVNGRLLKHYCEEMDATLHVPEVVRKECKTLIEDEVTVQHTRFAASHKRLGSLGANLEEQPPELEQMVEAGQTRLENILKDVGAVDLPIPDGLDHRTVLDRLQQGKKPFKGTPKNRDAGYRDALIWESLLAIPKEDEEDVEVALVSGNVNDFGTEVDGSWKLHPDLAPEAKARGLEVTLFQSVDDLVRMVVKPQLPISDQATALLATPEGMSQLEDVMQNFLVEKTTYSNVADAMRWKGIYVETVTVSEVYGIIESEVADIRELDDEVVVGEVSCSVEMLLDFFVFRSDAYILDAEDFATLSTVNDHYFEGQDFRTVAITLELSFRIGSDQDIQIVDATITNMELEEEEF